MKNTSSVTKQYIEQRDEGYWILGTRISFDSVVYAFLAGESPESIAQNFPLLSLEQIHGAITFYFANQELINSYLEKAEEEFEKLRLSLRERNPALHQKLIDAKAQKLR